MGLKVPAKFSLGFCAYTIWFYI